MAEKKVRVDIRAELDGSGFNQAEAGFDKTAEAARRVRRPMEDVEASAQKLDRMLGRLAVRVAGVFLGWKAGQVIKDAALLSARLDTLNVVLEVVGRNAGYSEEEITGFAEGVREMGITLVQSRESVIKLAQAQIDLTNANKLARIAQDAAVIGNVNSSEALGRLIHGIQSAQVEVLRTIGITVNFENAYQRLAEQLGKNTDQLTDAEKAQARVNVVMEAGERIAGTYEAAMGTAGKQIGSMERLAEDAQLKLGKLFTDEVLTVGVRVLTEGLKGVNEELDSMIREDGVTSKGEDVANVIAFMADSVLGAAAAFRLLGNAMGAIAALAASIGPGFGKKQEAISELYNEEMEKILAMPSMFRRALEQLRAERARDAGKPPGVSAGAESGSSETDGGPSADEKKFLDQLLSSTPTARALEHEKNLELLRREVNANRISYAQYIEVVDLLDEAFAKSDPLTQKRLVQEKERNKLIQEEIEHAEELWELRVKSIKEGLDEEAKAMDRVAARFERDVQLRSYALYRADEYVERLRDETVAMQSSGRVRQHLLDGLYLEYLGLERGTQAWDKRMAAIDSIRELQERVNESFSLGANRGFERYVRSVRDVAGQTEELFTSSFRNMEDAMTDWLKTGTLSLDTFADEFETMIYRMIVQQQILGPLTQAVAGGISFLAGGSTTEPGVTYSITGHGGAVAGVEGTGRKRVDPAVFDGARRYHSGGLVGDEVPIIAQRGEGVFTPAQMKRLAPVDGARELKVEIINNGTPQRVVSAQPTFDPKRMIVQLVTQDMNNGGPISQSVQNTFALRRSAS